jgi:DivIVA domain-containing protein
VTAEERHRDDSDLSPDVIRSVRFSVGRRGYVPAQVDAFLERLALSIERTDGEEQFSAASRMREVARFAHRAMEEKVRQLETALAEAEEQKRALEEGHRRDEAARVRITETQKELEEALRGARVAEEQAAAAAAAAGEERSSLGEARAKFEHELRQLDQARRAVAQSRRQGEALRQRMMMDGEAALARRRSELEREFAVAVDEVNQAVVEQVKAFLGGLDLSSMSTSSAVGGDAPGEPS